MIKRIAFVVKRIALGYALDMTELKYKLDDKPGWLALSLYGLQWWIISMPTIIIIGAILAQTYYEPGAGQVLYMQKLFVIMGLGIIVQVLWGRRLPLIIGPSSVLLIGILLSLSAGMAATHSAIIICGLLLALIGFSGLLSRIHKFFTARIVTVILLLIAFTLTPLILKMIFADEARVMFNLFFALSLVAGLIIANRLLPGIWKSTTVIWGIVMGSLLCGWLGDVPLLPEPLGAVNYDGLSIFLTGLEFDPGTILTFLFCAMGLLINELGSVEAVGQMLKVSDMNRRINRGVGVTGMANLVSGASGVIGPVDFTMSSGIISATGCASRFTLVPAGALFVLCAFFPQLIALLVNIPGLIMGALLLYLMVSQLASGFMMMVKDKAVTDFNSAVIIAVPLMVGILISFAPQQAMENIPPLLRSIVGNGFVMGVITVLVMEHVVYRKN